MVFEVQEKSINLIDGDTLVQNTKNPYSVEFLFDEHWDGLTKDVIFRVGNVTEMVRLGDENICTLPSKFLENGGLYLYVMVEGFSGDISLVADWCIAGKVLYRTEIDDGDDPGPEPPDPGTYEELKEAIGDVSQLDTESKDLTGAVNELKEALDNGGGGDVSTATDAEVDAMIQEVFGEDTP